MEPTRSPAPVLIANYAGPRAFAPRTRAALRGLGYELVSATPQTPLPEGAQKPALRLVDERQLGDLTSGDADPETPIVVLTGQRPRFPADSRVRGGVERPVELSPLYRALQDALESHPRRTPRVATQLSARCVGASHRLVGAVVSLSEHGCLFQTSTKAIQTGDEMNLQFALPDLGVLTARAECRGWQTTRGVGLVFSGTSSFARRAIRRFVTQRLASL